jgi:carboxypeptidase PM20D1
MRTLLLLLGSGVLLLVGFAVVRTVGYGSAPPVLVPAADIAVPPGAAGRLAGSLRIPTISHEEPAAFDAEAFRALHTYLQMAFPRAHAELQRETVAMHSLLYAWRGRDPSLKSILLAGHLDVVPVEPGTEKNWQEDPFGGQIANGFIWGRGAIDNKSAVAGTLEAVEMLLAEGFRPVRTIYLAYGHDEEVGGTGGAREIAALLKRRGVELEMVLDEGGVVGEGILPRPLRARRAGGNCRKGLRQRGAEYARRRRALLAAAAAERDRHSERGDRAAGGEPDAGAARGPDARALGCPIP